MRRPRFSVTGLLFTIALVAANFGLFRLFAVELGLEQSWNFFGIWLLPAVNVLAVLSFRARKLERRTPRVVGLLLACWASLVIFATIYVARPDESIDLYRSVGMPLVEWFQSGLVQVLGTSRAQSEAVQLSLAVAIEYGLPAIFFAAPIAVLGPLLARLSERVARPRSTT